MNHQIKDPDDLYNRKALLERSLERLDEELDKVDRDDILALVQFQNDKQNELLWINRCITALIVLRKKLKTSFRLATKDDIRMLFEDVNKNGYETHKGEKREYAGSTDEKFRKIIRLFYKVVYGENNAYPEAVAWLSTKIRKRKQAISVDANMYLTEEEILKVIDKAPSLQKKAMFASGYECGGRPEEFLNLTNQDIIYDEKGIRLILRGKTVDRPIRIAVYHKLLQEWLDVHPRKNETRFPLWISEATNFKNRKLGLRGWEKVVAQTVKNVTPHKRPVPYILRHSRATFLASVGWNEAKLRLFFGWGKGSDMPKIYIHLSGRDIDNDILSLNGDTTIKQVEHKIKSTNCVRCRNELYPNAPLCPNCALPTSLDSVYLEGITGHVNQKSADEIKSDLQKLREQDKGNDSRWSTVISLFESLMGVPQRKYGMTSLCYKENER